MDEGLVYLIFTVLFYHNWRFGGTMNALTLSLVLQAGLESV